MRISDWSSGVCSSDLVLQDLPSISFDTQGLKVLHGIIDRCKGFPLFISLEAEMFGDPPGRVSEAILGEPVFYLLRCWSRHMAEAEAAARLAQPVFLLGDGYAAGILQDRKSTRLNSSH